jgi:glutaminyl-tRNA synthetase
MNGCFESFSNVTTVYATYDADTLGKNPTDGRKVKGVIHFVEASTALKAEFRLYDRLFTLVKDQAITRFTVTTKIPFSLKLVG